ncbi:MAG: c-type cytochrome [Burkholderiaceae bacterium]
MSDISHEEDHTGPIKNPKQLLATVIFAFIAPVFLIIGLVFFVTSGNKMGPGAPDAPQTLEQRIQPVGMVEVRDANREPATGEAVFKAQCTNCHTAGLLGAPKFGDAAAWGPRVATGFDTLLHAAVAGMGAMPAQSGGDFSDFEIARAVVYMANAGGAKFAEPKAPAAAASDAASSDAAAPAAAPASAAVAQAAPAASTPAKP